MSPENAVDTRRTFLPLCARVLLAAAMSITHGAFADSIQVTTGVAFKEATIAGFEPDSEPLPVIQLRINRAVTGRWSFNAASSAMIDPFSARKTALFGLASGIAYDSSPWSKIERVQDERGAHEVLTMPRWHWRYHGQLGAWWYSDALIPSRLSYVGGYPIAGLLLGLQSGAMVTRFLGRQWSVSGNFEMIFPIGTYPLRFYMGSLAFGYWYN